MHIKNYIDKLEAELPELCETAKLIQLGIFSSPGEAAKRRDRGDKPEFLNLSPKRILYHKKSVIEWLRECHQASKNRISRIKKKK